MAEKVYIVTPPDNVNYDGIRILLVDLDPIQTEMVSDCLKHLGSYTNLIVYMWKSGDDEHWLFEQKHKCNIIVFNAESDAGIIVGYMAAQPNAYYLGTLKNLTSVNNNAIYTVDQMINLMEKITESYGIL